MSAAHRYEFATAADPSLNYCLWHYAPAAPVEDKFRSINLLLHSFEVAGLGQRAYALVDALRDGIGPFRTVFGVKWMAGQLAWEFYFYDYARTAREVSISRVLAVLAPFARSPVMPDENLPYFMFSIDIDGALVEGRRALDVVHMYLGNPGSTVSSGIAYALETGGATLENFYFFFDAATQRDEAAAKIASSAFFDASRLSMDEALVPRLRDCHTICVANKRSHDCTYFSGVDVDQLAFFLGQHAYPPPIRDFVREHRSRLDHLRFDVGADYRMEGGRLRYLKSGFYGVF